MRWVSQSTDGVQVRSRRQQRVENGDGECTGNC